MSILCYHSVDPDWSSPLAIGPADFAEQCAWLARDVRVLPLAEAVKVWPSGRLPRRTAAVTFDDGFAELHAHAFPELVRHRIPATFFVVSGTLTPGGLPVTWVDTPAPHPLRTLSLEEILEMQEAGICFGSHSSTHRDLTQLSDDECERDLRESRELLEELLGRPVPFLAYPRGRSDARVRRAAARAGFSHAFTLPERREAVDPFGIPRVGVYRGNGVHGLRNKTSPWYLAVRLHPVYGPLRRALGMGAPVRMRA